MSGQVGSRGTPLERFSRKCVRDASGCVLWTAKTTSKGYGQFYCSERRRLVKAHRWAYERFVGPIPDGLVIDHLCRNRACVNPEHLEPVTGKENILRGDGVCARMARKTHCKRGHEFTPENTCAMAGGGRSCRTCKRAHNLAQKAK